MFVRPCKYSEYCCFFLNRANLNKMRIVNIFINYYAEDKFNSI